MAAAKAKIPGPLDGAEYRGKTAKGGFTVRRGGASWATCKACGSTLYPSRRESTKVRTIGGEQLKVDRYVCGCETGYEVRRPMGVAA